MKWLCRSAAKGKREDLNNSPDSLRVQSVARVEGTTLAGTPVAPFTSIIDDFNRRLDPVWGQAIPIYGKL